MDLVHEEKSATAARPHVVRVRVRYGDVDISTAVFFPRYFDWVDVAFNEYMRAAGLIYTPDKGVDVGGRHLMQNVVFGDIHLHIHSPSTIGDLIAVHATLKELRKKTMVFDFRMVDDNDGRLLATATVKTVWVDVERFKSVEIPGFVTEILERSRHGMPPETMVHV